MNGCVYVGGGVGWGLGVGGLGNGMKVRVSVAARQGHTNFSPGSKELLQSQGDWVHLCVFRHFTKVGERLFLTSCLLPWSTKLIRNGVHS